MLLLGLATLACVFSVGLLPKVLVLKLVLLGLTVFACCTLIAPLVTCEGWCGGVGFFGGGGLGAYGAIGLALVRLGFSFARACFSARARACCCACVLIAVQTLSLTSFHKASCSSAFVNSINLIQYL